MKAHVEVTISKRHFNVCVPMSINEIVEMTIFLCLICFSIYDKLQGFVDESVFFKCYFVYLFIFFAFYAKIQDGWEKDFWEKSPVDSAKTVAFRLGRKFR